MRRRLRAAAEAEARKLELARNRLKYTVLRASQSGVVTAVRFEVGQVVAEGPADRLDRERRRARDRRRRAGGSPGRVQDGAVQGVARERARANVRGRAARTVAAGGGADAHLSRPPEAGDAAAAAARRDRHARRRAAGRRSAGRGHPGHGDHPEQRPAGGLGGSSARAPSRSEPSICIHVVSARLSQRRGARLRAAGRRARRDRRRAEDGAGLAGRAARCEPRATPIRKQAAR